MNVAQELIDSILQDPAQIGRLAGAIGNSPLLKADAFTAGAGGQQLVAYDLESTIQFVYPFLENVPLIAGNPARGIAPMPRVPGNGGTGTHWKQVTSIDPNNVAGGVGRGQRGAAIAINSVDKVSQYYGMGVEVPIDFETRYEGGPLTPESMAIAAQSGLRALMIFEEKMLIGGNNSFALGTTPTPTVSDGAATGGVGLPGTISVIAVALSLEGYSRATSVPITATAPVPSSITRVNMDASTLTFGAGSARKSANATLVLTANHTALATVAPVTGAVAYAWFWGAAGSEVLGAITGLSGIEIKAVAAGTQTAASLPAADNSTNAYVPDGIITQMVGTTFTGASGSYVKYNANGVGAGSAAGSVASGVGLTGDGAGGIVELDAMNLDRWNNYRLGFTRWLINAQTANVITQKILSTASGVTSLFRTSQPYPGGGGGPQAGLHAGERVTSYQNKYTGQNQDIVVHPVVPPGMVIGWSDRIPYPLSNVTNLLQIKYRQGYYQIDWPLVTRQYQEGVYVDETFQNYFTPAFGILANLGSL